MEFVKVRAAIHAFPTLENVFLVIRQSGIVKVDIKRGTLRALSATLSCQSVFKCLYPIRKFRDPIRSTFNPFPLAPPVEQSDQVCQSKHGKHR